MKNPKNISAQDQAFLDQIDALLGISETSAPDLALELELFGIDPNELRQAAFKRIRSFATEKYSSRGLDMPHLMSEALRQLRPPTPQEQEAAQSARAESRVQGLLSSLKLAGNAYFTPAPFAPAYRNKQEGTPESDEQLVEEQQRDLDGEDE
jgi:hypothetical protein